MSMTIYGFSYLDLANRLILFLLSGLKWVIIYKLKLEENSTTKSRVNNFPF